MTTGQHMTVREARIPVRDGTELAATLYLPAQPVALTAQPVAVPPWDDGAPQPPATPVPALLEYLPYRKDDAMLARD